MRLWIKLAAVLLLALALQVGVEIGKTVVRYPYEVDDLTTLTPAAAEKIAQAEQDFRQCSRLTKWLVTHVLQLPLHDFGEPTSLPAPKKVPNTMLAQANIESAA